MSKATNRKLVRAAIVETAEALTALKPEWERRDDLKLMVEGVERAINEALKLLQNSAPTEQVREAQVAAYTSLEGLREALAKPAGAAPVAKPTTRRPRREAQPVETRELFRDDQAGVLVVWILDPFGEGGPVQVVSVVAGAETRYELVVGDEVKASAPANRSTWREVKAGLIQQAAKLVAATA